MHAAPASGLRRRERRSGGSDGLGPAHRLAVPLAQHPKLVQLLWSQLFIPVGEIPHGIVKPVLLVLRQRFDDTAAENVAEQLVPCLLEHGGGSRGHYTSILILAHAPSFCGTTVSRPQYSCLLYTSDAADERSSVDL